MTIQLLQIDAFTNQAFGGNPAAVCFLDDDRSDEWMQSVAAEMNLSETAFLAKRPDNSYNLRWFTPNVEVDLCGHATLASSHALWSEGLLSADEPAQFHTRSGLLTCTKEDDGWISMDFPTRHADWANEPTGMLAALGIPVEEVRFIGRNVDDYLVEVATAQTVYGLTPDFGRLKAVETRGIIVTSRSDRPEFDMISRFFAPGAGIDEDPVTGSAHCCLTDYWAPKLNKPKLVAYQASERGGTIKVEYRGPRVLLMGQAVTVLRGELLA
ncbi:MAG: PhzF family phenazine biosynthesis protein [Chloroflexota bacterium]